MIKLTEEPIETQQALDAVAHPDAGANLLFVGTTRQWTEGSETQALKYECYPKMAIRQMEKIRDEAMQKWDLKGVCVIHRLGVVSVGETSIAVAVSSAHRQPAFEAGPWLLERLKQVVPVWKQDIDPQGRQDWVHPIDPEVAS